MPPKKKEAAAKDAGQPAADDGAERELVEKELVIGYLKSKLGRCFLWDMCMPSPPVPIACSSARIA